jgi:uncharacterized protein
VTAALSIPEFLAWQERLRLAKTTFSGYRGSELFRPIDGVQDEWTTLYRYDTDTTAGALWAGE